MIAVMSTKSPPKRLGAAEVILYTTIGSSHRKTYKTSRLIGGKQLGSAAGLAIGRYADEPGYYLFYCDSDWYPMTNTWHDTIEDAKRAAEFEYEGAAQTWQSPS
jgi:hypothetical protein